MQGRRDRAKNANGAGSIYQVDEGRQKVIRDEGAVTIPGDDGKGLSAHRIGPARQAARDKLPQVLRAAPTAQREREEAPASSRTGWGAATTLAKTGP